MWSFSSATTDYPPVQWAHLTFAFLKNSIYGPEDYKLHAISYLALWHKSQPPWPAIMRQLDFRECNRGRKWWFSLVISSGATTVGHRLQIWKMHQDWEACFDDILILPTRPGIHPHSPYLARTSACAINTSYLRSAWELLQRDPAHL